MTLSELNILSALFARSNMGQPDPTADQMVNWFKGREDVSLSLAVDVVCGEFYEGDNYADIFLGEARVWLERIENQPLSGYDWVANSPEIAKLMEAIK